MSNKEKDPLMLGDLDPSNIEAKVTERSTKKKPPPTELEIKKEERLAAKEQRRCASQSGSAHGAKDAALISASHH